MDELKPCPFCGSSDTMVSTRFGVEVVTYRKCKTCGAEAPIDMWNLRVTPPWVVLMRNELHAAKAEVNAMLRTWSSPDAP